MTPADVVLIGVSAAARALAQEIDRAAGSDAKVLVTGESGAGKDIVAHLIHARGARRKGPFVSINCVGVPDALLESELFGHTRGSFTGAYRDRTGLLQAAHRGTAFLDEVGEMSLRMQGLLLRFLETGEIQPVGGWSPNPVVNVRVIAATNKSLRRLVEEKTFREDLFYRLNVIELCVPPLRDRLEDVPVLARYFLDRFCEQYRAPRPDVSPDALDRLASYRWPGNVRELRNAVERTLVRHAGHTIAAFDLPDRSKRTPPTVTSVASRPAAKRQIAEVLFERLSKNGESFWDVAYEPFMRRDLTRAQIRQLVTLGLQATYGSYRLMAELFGISAADYKRFLGVLRKHQCHVPFQPFRRSMLKSESMRAETREPLAS